jgi:nucleoside-diphosphate-sugar epimerase
VPKAGGERYIVAGHPVFGNDMALAAAKVHPDRDITKGNPDAAYRKALEDKATRFDGSKAARDLGFSYTPREKTLMDLFEYAKAKGQ